MTATPGDTSARDARLDPAGLSGSCPIPFSQYEQIVLGHGSGGRLSADLLRQVFLPAFGNPTLAELEDQATLDLCTGGAGTLPRLTVTTDAFVVRPIFFPGGDIGSLAIHGTVNDLAVGGARPLAITAAFILEEGLLLGNLKRIVESMRRACDQAGVSIVAGDTKVVDRGKADQIFITTTGVGIVPAGRRLSIHAAQPGDCIVLSGTIGDHGIAILSVREGLDFETVLESDSASVVELANIVLAASPDVRCMRDPTRGGLASALNELAEASRVGVKIRESTIPLRPEVRAACEILGLDPLHVANEGKLIAAVPAADADRVVAALRAHPLGRDAVAIGTVVAEHPGMVTLRSLVGGERVVSMLTGEQLPRIC
jgi:hydrogenase expression/formation protein HypE